VEVVTENSLRVLIISLVGVNMNGIVSVTV